MTSVQELRAAVSPPSEPGKNSGKAPMASYPAPIGMLLLAAVIGACAGVAIDRVLLQRDVAPPPATVAATETAAESRAVAAGTFIQPDANNPLYRGSGGVSVTEREVVLAEDFAVTPGPDYRVLLVPKPAIRGSDDIANTMYVDLGPLAAFKGSQRFVVPAGVDLTKYPSVVIWCAPYAALISAADLSFAK